MKKTLLSIIAIAIAHTSFAQWANGNDIYNTNTGNVGIGIVNPVYKLHVIGDIGLNQPYAFKFANGQEIRDNGNGGLKIYSGLSINNYVSAGGVYTINGGNVGIGTPNPLNKFVISDGSIGLEINPNVSLTNESGTYITSYNRTTPSYADMVFDNGGSYIVFKHGGNVGIGTITPDAKLAVNGTIHSKEVKVDLIGWPDYVFKSKYNLPSLKEVKNYIDKNQHLPEIPSEQEVAKNGINLGEMNKLLTKKVEEITLYLIQQREENEAQQKLITNQQKANLSQQEQINQLKEQLSIITKTLTKN